MCGGWWYDNDGSYNHRGRNDGWCNHDRHHDRFNDHHGWRDQWRDEGLRNRRRRGIDLGLDRVGRYVTYRLDPVTANKIVYLYEFQVFGLAPQPLVSQNMPCAMSR